MRNLLMGIFIAGLVTLSNGLAHAEVYNGFWSVPDKFSATYPIVNIEDKANQEAINTDIENIIHEYASKVDDGDLNDAKITYYKKYEDDNIVNLMFYVESAKPNEEDKLSGFTVTYDKHTGKRVPMDRYLIITLPQLQDALNHSKAFAVDGLDNGVNLTKKIPYVSQNYFIVTDGSVALLYQPGDLQDPKEGAGKIIISPETVRETYRINTAQQK